MNIFLEFAIAKQQLLNKVNQTCYINFREEYAKILANEKIISLSKTKEIINKLINYYQNN